MRDTQTLLFGAFILGGFLSGSVMYSRLVPLLSTGKDVAALGADRNPGASNVFLNCGIPLGLLCLACDLLKGFLPVFWAVHMVDIRLLAFAAVLSAPVLGHALAPLNHFHGGKCISTAFGCLLALLPVTRIVFVLAGLYIFFSVIVKINPTRYRSLLTFALFGVIAGVYFAANSRHSLGIGCSVIAVTAVLRHTKYLSYIPEEQQPKMQNERL